MGRRSAGMDYFYRINEEVVVDECTIAAESFVAELRDGIFTDSWIAIDEN
jgi:hypothetical protein